MTINQTLSILTLLFLVSCHTAPKQTEASLAQNDTINHSDSVRIVKKWVDIATDGDSSYTLYSYRVMLKDGLDSIRATLNDSTMFIATKGQIMCTNYIAEGKPTPEDGGDVWIADGRFGYINSEKLKRVDSPCFKFNFSKVKFIYDKDNELRQSADRIGIDLNVLVRRILDKDNEALLKFYRLKNTADGAAAESLPYVFWELINLWSDKELSLFISKLDYTDKKGFCDLLIESSLCNPFEYYKHYYPLTLKQINSVNN